MPLFFSIVVAVILTILSVVTGFIWGLPFAVLALVIGVGYVLMGRKENESVATVERGKSQEPTGVVRSTTGSGTANERVGQA